MKEVHHEKNKAIAIIAAICAVSIAGGVVGYTVGQRSEYMNIGAPRRYAIRDARGITVGAVGAITVPGYERMSFKAGRGNSRLYSTIPPEMTAHLLFQSCSFGERDLSLQRAPAG